MATIDNSTDNTLVTGTSGDDSIQNSGANVTINALAGDDTVRNYGHDVTINGGEGNDSVDNWSRKNVYIYGGAGDDSIFSDTINVTMNGENGNDYIFNGTGSEVSIAGGRGNDTIATWGAGSYGVNVTLSGGLDNDLISIEGGSNLITYTSGDGNDVINGFNETSTLQIGGGTGTYSSQVSGNDIIVTVGDGSITLTGAASLSTVNISGEEAQAVSNISNSTSNTVISGTSGDDSIVNTGIKVTINALSGNDNISDSGMSSSIDGGAGDDTITNSGIKVTINAGDGNDIVAVDNSGISSSIDGGTGDDTVYNHAVAAKILGGDGSDNVYNYSSASGTSINSGNDADYVLNYADSVTILSGAGNDTVFNRNSGYLDGKTYSTADVANSVSVDSGDGNDSIDNAGKLVTINAGAGNDRIHNDGASVTIDGGADNDSIYSYASDVSISGGAGDDELWNNTGNNVTVKGGIGNDKLYNTFSAGTKLSLDGGEGNDAITNWGSYNTLDGGADDDTIYSTANNVTILGSAGADRISLHSNAANNLIQYALGDGFDTVTGFNETSTLSIGGAAHETAVSGNDIIVTVGDGSITLSGAASLSTVNISGVEGAPVNPLLVVGTEGADNLSNNLDGATIDALGGSDTVYNSGSGVSIDAGTGNDSIKNTAAQVSIVGGSGKDSVTNTKTKVTINGGADNDRIVNSAATVSIMAGAGNDLVSLGANAKNNVITYTAGNDSIIGFNATSTLNLGDDTYSKETDGNDVILTVGTGKITLQGAASLSALNIIGSLVGGVIENSSNNVTVTGTANDDTINNSGSNVTILALAGNDSIKNYASNVSIDSGDGYDYIYSQYGASTTIVGGAGNDTFNNNTYSDNALIDGGAGDDYFIYNWGINCTLLGGAGNDTVTNYKNGYSGGKLTYSVGGANSKMDGGTGDDFIENTAEYVSMVGGAGADTVRTWGIDGTISGGTGNDIISLESDSRSNLIEYAAGDGNDLITGFNETSTLSIGGAAHETAVSGNDIIVTVGKGKITLQGAAKLSKPNIVNPLNIVGTSGADKITNTLAGATIQALGGNDKITNSGSSAKIDAGTGNDSIKNTAAQVSIVGGAGKDSVTNTKTKVTIDAGADNDRIVNSAASVSIIAGAGNDLVSLGTNAKNNVITYTAGNDTIKGFNATSTLKLGDGSAAYSKETVGNDVIITVGDDSITLLGAATLTTFNILGTEEKHTGVVIDGKTARLTDDFTEDIYSIADNLDVTTIDASVITYDIELVGNKKANSILGGEGNDTLIGGKGNDSLTGGAGSDIFLYNNGDGNDIITDYTEEDALQIASGSVGSVTFSGSDVVLTVGKGKITVKGGLTQKTITYCDADGNDNYIVNKTVDFNEGTGATLLANYAKSTFDESDYPQYVNTIQTIDASAVTHDLAITGNKNANTLIGGKGNDTLNGAAGSDNLTGGAGSDVFVYTAGNDLITDYEEEDRIRIDGSVSKVTTSKENVIFTVDGKGKISVKGGAGKVITYEETSEKTRFYPVSINAAGTGATLESAYVKDSFDVADYGDYEGTLKTVDASKVSRDLSITANDLANKIIGGSGNDTLYGGKGNDNLNGGKGSDVFVYNNGDGNDTIIGYTQGEDRILVALKNISSVIGSASVSGSDVVFKVGKGNITVNKGTEQLITFVDKGGKEHFYPDEVNFSDDGKQATILADYHKSAFKISDYGSYGTTVQTINGAAVTHDISITANSKANTIYGSTNNDYMDGGAGKDVLYGSEGNDTLLGGTGNDTLWGGDGDDVFLYASGGGNDVIQDYAEGETISVTGAVVDKATVSGSNVVLTIGSNKITVKDAKDTPVTYYDSDGKHTYPAASNDLLIDDNYSADAAQITDIAEPFKASYTPYDFDESMRNAQCVMRNEIPVSCQLSAKS